VAHLLEADCTPWARHLCGALPTAEGAAATDERAALVTALLLSQGTDIVEDTLRAAPQLFPTLPLNDHLAAIGAWPEALQPAAWRVAMHPAQQATVYLAPHQQSFKPRQALPTTLPPAAAAALGVRLRRLHVVGATSPSPDDAQAQFLLSSAMIFQDCHAFDEAARSRFSAIDARLQAANVPHNPTGRPIASERALVALLAAATGLQELDVVDCPLERYHHALPATLTALRVPHDREGTALAGCATRLTAVTSLRLHWDSHGDSLHEEFAAALRALPHLRSLGVKGTCELGGEATLLHPWGAVPALCALTTLTQLTLRSVWVPGQLPDALTALADVRLRGVQGRTPSLMPTLAQLATLTRRVNTGSEPTANLSILSTGATKLTLARRSVAQPDCGLCTSSASH
jgi:hypothetical protein